MYFAHDGFTVERFAAEKFGLVVVRDELVYRKELRLLEEFTVDFQLAGLSADGVQFRVRNTFRNTADDVAATVTSEGVWFDLERRQPRLPPPDLDRVMRAVRGARICGDSDQRFTETAQRAVIVGVFPGQAGQPPNVQYSHSATLVISKRELILPTERR
jgi:acyl-CoA thioesterase FadM